MCVCVCACMRVGGVCVCMYACVWEGCVCAITLSNLLECWLCENVNPGLQTIFENLSDMMSGKNKILSDIYKTCRT